MWNTPTVVVAPAVEPVTLAEAKIQCRVDDDDTSFDDDLNHLVKAARVHAEYYCGVYFATQTVRAQCDSFIDMARLPMAPVQSVSSIAYIDTAGDPQTVAAETFSLRQDAFEPAIRIKRGQTWPAIEIGSRITLEAVVGGVPDDDVRHAMKMLVAHWFVTREAVIIGTITANVPISVDALLANHRR
jgi:uncharacterized phiE125 gp8 family phage protein